MVIITWYLGKRRIELGAHRCQTYMRKMSVQRALYCLVAKAARFLNRTDIVKTSVNVEKLQF